jgi:short-subunit dehydrogenase
LLAGRRADRLAAVAADLTQRGAQRVEVVVCDLGAPADARSILDGMVTALGGLDHVLLAYGVLGDQEAARADQKAAEAMLAVNFTSAAAWALAAAERLERQGHGSLVVIGSVAGDRGRRANFIYGAAKAGLAALVQGISHRFGGRGPRAVIVKPGPTITPMTEGMVRKGPLWSTPRTVARVVRRAADRGGPVVYAPGRWRFIMLVIRALPPFIFNRLDI